MKTKGREEPFIPLDDPSGQNLIPVGDPQGSKGWARVQSAKEARDDPRRANEENLRIPSGEEIVFDTDYELLLFSERETRRRLLAPWRMFPPDSMKKHVDPYVARELHRQEKRDKELRNILDALLGKDSDWRSALCIESQRNIDARGELGRIQDNSWAEGDTDELGRFLGALKAVMRLKKRGPVKRAKTLALIFVLGCRVKGEPPPTRGEVLRFLKLKGMEVSKNNAARYIFTGPILSDLPRGRSGRPKKTRRREKFDEFEN